MDDLVQFLSDRINDDEQAAKDADPGLGNLLSQVEYLDDEVQADQRHIVRHDPARELREVEAKRAVIAEHEIRDGRCRVCAAHAHDHWTRFRAPCTTLRLLALPYADHPDYREDWRP